MVEDSDSGGQRAPRHRLQPEDAALLETLTPELARLLYPDQIDEPFTVTLRYRRLEGEAGETARRLEAEAIEFAASKPAGDGAHEIHSATFGLRQIEEFHELYHLAEAASGTDEIEVHINGREVPLTRELWLPLVWSLRK